MNTLLEKLNYKGQKRIAIINSESNFPLLPVIELEDIQVDNKIDPRYPYDFIIIFTRELSDIEKYTPEALHNLAVDGILWYCYPKKSSKKFKSDIDRDHGWEALNSVDFFGIRLVALDEDWSALRFRNKKFIKSTSERFNRKTT